MATTAPSGHTPQHGDLIVRVSRLELVDIVGMADLEPGLVMVRDRGARHVVRRACPTMRRLADAAHPTHLAGERRQG